MILDAILKLLTSPLIFLLEQLPTSEWALPEGVVSTVANILCTCGYLLPMNTIVTIITLRLGIYLFKYTMAFIVRVKSFIPFMGS